MSDLVDRETLKKFTELFGVESNPQDTVPDKPATSQSGIAAADNMQQTPSQPAPVSIDESNPLAAFNQMFGDSKEPAAPSTVDKNLLDQFSKISDDPKYQSPIFQAASKLAQVVPNKVAAIDMAGQIKPEDREEFLNALYDAAASTKAYGKKSFAGKVGDRLVAGVSDLLGSLSRPLNPEGLTDDQRQFAHQIEKVWESADPKRSPNAAWYSPSEAVLSAAEMTPSLMLAGGAGKVAGVGAELAGAGRGLTTLAEGAASAATFAPGMYGETYDSLIEQGVAPNTAKWAAVTSAGLQSALFAGLPKAIFPKSWTGKAINKRLADGFAKNYIKAAGIHGPSIMAGAQAIDETVKDLAKGESPEVKKYIYNAANTYLQSIGSFAVISVPGAIANSGKGLKKAVTTDSIKAERINQDVKKFIEKDQIPSRTWWKDAKLPGGKSKADRYMGLRVMAREYEARKAAEAAPAVAPVPKESEAKPAAELLQAAPPEAQAAPQGVETPQAVTEAAPAGPAAEAKQQNLPGFEATPHREPAQAPQPVEPPANKVEADAQAKLLENPKTIGVANAVVDTIRQLRGDPSLVSESPEKIDQWVAEAADRFSKNPNYGSNLVGELASSERNANAVETVALKMEYKARNDRFIEANNKQIEAEKAGDPVALAQANIEARNALESVNQLEEIARKTGTTWGRSGLARRILLNEDFSVAGITRRVMTKNGGKPLTPEDTAAIKQMGDRIAELEQKLRDVESGKVDVGSDTAIEAAIKKLKPEKTLSKRKAVASKKIDDAWDEVLKATTPKENLAKGESGALNVDVLTAYGKLATAYAEYGVTTFAEFFAHAKAKIGEANANAAKEYLLAAWKKADEDGLIYKREFDVTNSDALSRYARKVAKSVIDAGTTELKPVVEAVHEELRNVVPDITERQTKDLISGYGKYSKLSQEKTDVILRDITGQLQQLSKLEDMAGGNAPSPTGRERRTPSEEERRLIKQVNEAKRKGGFYDEEGKIKSALASAKTAVSNRIKDLNYEIKHKEKIVKNRTELKADAELIALRAERDRVQKIHDEIFKREPMTLEQRQKSVERGLDRAIADLSKDIEEGNIGYKKKGKPLSTPQIDAKRKTLKDLQDQRDKLREETGIAEKRDNERYRISLMDRLNKLSEANRKGILLPKKERKDRSALDILDIKYQIKLETDKAKALEEKIARGNRSTARKALDLIPESVNASRAILTSMDFSAVLRQGAIASFSHPILAVKALYPMFKAAWSEKGQFEIMQKLRSRDNALLYDRAGLAITLSEGKLTAQEEAFRGNLLKNVPAGFLNKGKAVRAAALPAELLIRGVAGSERAYVTFLNEIRADVFDSMVKSLSRTGEVTLPEAKIIANYVNVATGRGNMGQYANASQLLSTVFFAPRYAVSRFQYILGQPAWGGGPWKGSGRVRVQIAKEYARFLAGISVFYGMASLTNLFQTDEREKIYIELDPRSADFGKLRYKEWRIDPLGGLAQVTTFLVRELTGESKKATGEIVGLRDFATLTGAKKQSGPASDDAMSVAGRFLRTKLSPWLGTAVSSVTGETPTGEKMTPSVFAQQTLIPLSFRDIYEQMQAQGVPRKVAFSTLVLFGMGSQKYEGGGSLKNFAEKIAEHGELSGTTKEGKSFNHRKQIGQIIRQARSLGYTSGQLENALRKDLAKKKYSDATIEAWVERLKERYP